jgi:hypothetical protein
VKTVQGRPKFDAIFLGEVTLNVLAFPDVHLSVTAGYIDSKSGRRYGSMTKLGGWSPETLRKLNDFLEALEVDVAAEVFDGGATGGGQEPLTTTTDGIPGL